MISMEPVLKRGYSSWDRAVLPDDEFALRVEGVRRALREARLGALVVVNYSLLGVMVDYADMAYLSGLQSGGALVVPLEGDPAFVSFGGGRELAFMRALTWLPIVPGAGKAFEMLPSELKARGVASGRIGIVGIAGIAPTVVTRIRDGLAGFELVPFDAELRALRAVKRPRELLAMRMTQGIVDGAVAAGVAAFAASGDNRSAMLEAERAARALKARDVRVLASMGGPELRPWEGRLDGRHAPLRLWVAAQYQGYWAEAAATTPPPREDAAGKAVRAMQAAVRGGVTAGDVAAAGVAALPPSAVESALSYGLGGTLGLAYAEGIAIVPGSTQQLPAGCVVALRAHVGDAAHASIASTSVVVGAGSAAPLGAARMAD
ncbi:MAG: aminopeptidase P family N-terminal domain-containing protein [Gammaproteobacteria bacterium]